jgi:threonine dehydrogenase-like Zn-dependent dehydrogenase
MRAGVIAAPGQARLARVARPEPGPGAVRVRIEGCGVCGSNAPVWEGRDWFAYPLRAGSPGHEGWGVVDAVGDGVAQLRPGTRVAVLSERAFAEYDTAPAAGVVALDALPAGAPFPGEAAGCAMNVFRRSGIAAGTTVAIVGVGFLGAVVAALAVHAGARVIAISRRGYALDVARGLGVDLAIPLADRHTVVERVRAATAGELCDVVIEAVGLQAPLDVAAELTRERGRLVIAGYHQDGGRQVDMQLWNWRGLDVINAHERDPAVCAAGMRAAAEAVADGRIPLDRLLTHRFALDELGAALEAQRARPDGFLKAVVVP